MTMKAENDDGRGLFVYVLYKNHGKNQNFLKAKIHRTSTGNSSARIKNKMVDSDAACFVTEEYDVKYHFYTFIYKNFKIFIYFYLFLYFYLYLFISMYLFLNHCLHILGQLGKCHIIAARTNFAADTSLLQSVGHSIVD